MAISTTSITESINTLVSAYRTQLRKPLLVLEAKKSVYEQINSALSILSDYFSTLQDLSTPLKKTDTDSVYYTKSATSSDTSVVTATATNDAAEGAHTISISQLAKNYTQISNEYTSTETKISGDPGYLGDEKGEFKIMVNGVTTNISVDIGTTDTDDEVLSNIAEAINSSDAKVNATVIHQTSSKSRLILTAEETGNVDTVLIKDTSKNLASLIQIHNAEYNVDSDTFTKSGEPLGITIRTNVGTGDKKFSISVNGITRIITVNIGATDTNDDVLQKMRDAINASDVSGALTAALTTVETTQEYLTIMNAKTEQDSTHYTATGTELSQALGSISPGTDYIFTIRVKDSTTGAVSKADITVPIITDETNETVLDNIRYQINESGLGVTASVGIDGDNRYLRIVSTVGGDVFSVEDKTGNMADTISIISDLFSVEDIDGTLATYTNIKTTQEKADTAGGYIYKDTKLNSEFKLNELDMERTSNTVSDAVTGITLNLLKVQTSPDVTIQVSNDTATVKGTVESWIDQYNSVLEYLYATTRMKEVGEEEFEGGPLSEEYFYKDLIWKLRSLMAKKVEGVTNSEYSHLFEIGITADSQGKLSISDSAKFEEALAENITNVSDLFNSTTEPEEGNTKGKAVELYDFIEDYVKTNGYIDASEDAYDNRVEYLDTRIARMETSINRKLAAYRKSLGYMQEMMAMLQGQYMMLMMYYGLPTGTSTM